MTTPILRTYAARPVAPRFLAAPAVLCSPYGETRFGLTLADALALDAEEGATICRNVEGNAGECLAICDEGAPGVWYVPVQWTAAPAVAA